MITFEKINKLNFKNTHGLAVSPEQVAYVCEDLEEFVHTWKDDPLFDCFLVKKGEVTVGFFALDFSCDRHSAYVSSSHFTCAFRCFFIDRRFQRQGLASQTLEELWKYLATAYPKLESVFLTVNFKNITAKNLYLREGFKIQEKPYVGGAAGPQHLMTKLLVQELIDGSVKVI
jgi:ribosomal protein S18 acetylase RimI-like enzyme